jgi:Putative peptidoglycan binding domain
MFRTAAAWSHAVVVIRSAWAPGFPWLIGVGATRPSCLRALKNAKVITVGAGSEIRGDGVNLRMRTMSRWIAIAVSVLLACVARPAAGSPRHVRKSRASLHAVRYSPRAQSSSQAKKRRTRRRRRSRRSYRDRAHLPVRPTAERISQIQSALARKGFYQGDPNGRLDTNTIAALQKFQSANNLQATGKIDALTLQKLGLGSDVAGLSPPKPGLPAASPASAPASASPASAPQSKEPASGAGTTTPPQPS